MKMECDCWLQFARTTVFAILITITIAQKENIITGEEGSTVTLPCGSDNLNANQYVILWYKSEKTKADKLVYYRSESTESIPPEFSSRYRVTTDSTALIISNIQPSDASLFRCGLNHISTKAKQTWNVTLLVIPSTSGYVTVQERRQKNTTGTAQVYFASTSSSVNAEINTTQKYEEGISGGVVVGIIIGCLLIVGILVVGIVCCRRNCSKELEYSPVTKITHDIKREIELIRSVSQNDDQMAKEIEAILTDSDGIEDISEDDLRQPKFTGTARCPYRSGDVYKGEFKDGLKHGTGCLYTWKDGQRGEVYSGQFHEDRQHGQGTFYMVGGVYYEGEWQNGKKHHGKMRYQNGDVYEGDWLNEKRHGQGQISFNHGGTYEGNWSKNVIHGTGKYITRTRNGYVYEGDFENNMFHGKGVYYHEASLTPDTTLPEYSWQNGFRYFGSAFFTPDGEAFNPDAVFVTDGNDHENNKGVATTLQVDDSSDKELARYHIVDIMDVYCLLTGDIYRGRLENGTPNGYGIIKYHTNDDIRFYEGNFEDGLKHGRGKVTRKDGATHEGTFENDLIDGKCIYTFRDGIIFKGKWKAGRPDLVKKGEYTIANGTKYKAVFSNGELQTL